MSYTRFSGESKFAADLSKSVKLESPWRQRSDDFRAFAEAGRHLADLHVNYETVEPYPLLGNPHGARAGTLTPLMPTAWRKWPTTRPGPEPDRSAIVCNAHITLSGIPDQAHQYRLGSRSALDWLLDRYQVKTDSKSGITNDPNDWATEHGDTRYIIDLIKRITTVSLRTVEIVQGLPQLPI